MFHVFKIIFLFLLNICCFWSCKKKAVEQVSTFPHKMYLKEIRTMGAAQLYTNKSTLNDAAILKTFIDGEDEYFFDTKRGNFYDSIQFLNADTVLIGAGMKFTYKQQGEEYQLLSYGIGFYDDPNAYTYSLFKHHYFEPSTQWSKEVRIGKGNFKEFRLLAMGYKLRRWAVFSNMNLLYSETKARVFNEFNPGFITNLNATDTLAVQAYEYVFTK